MKVAFLINSNDIGGAEYVSYQHVRIAKEAGMDVLVISGEDGLFCSKIKELGVKVVLAPVINLKPWPLKDDLVQLFKGLDVVFNCNWFTAHASVKEMKSKKLFRFRYFSILHSNIDWVIRNTLPYNSIIHKYYAINDKIISAFVKAGVSRDKFTLIPNCVDTDLIVRKGEANGWYVRSRLGIRAGDLVIGMTTRIAGDKNVLDAVRLLNEVNKHRPASLVILGGAPENEACKAYEAKLRAFAWESAYADRIYLQGKMSNEEVYRWQVVFDVAVNLSPSEGLPISMLEQMAAGIYCLYPRVGGIADVLTGLGFLANIRQRTSSQEIYRHFNYSDDELGQYVTHLAGLNLDFAKRKGDESAEFVRKFRSLDYQRKLFIQFLNV